MRGIPLAFLLTGIGAVLVGMAWGIQMSATGDHLLAPAHAHLNLIGWVTFSIFAFYYQQNQSAAGSVFARIHYVVALAGLLMIVPGIVAAINGTGETLAKLGSALTLVSMVWFGFVVLRFRLR
jgi:hypothetical protein